VEVMPRLAAMVPPMGCPATSVPGDFDRLASGHGVGPYPGAETLCDRFGAIEADLQCLNKGSSGTNVGDRTDMSWDFAW